MAGEPKGKRITRVAWRFNPLRPSMAGEPGRFYRKARERHVSIHSGHQWPENRQRHEIDDSLSSVSIHSGHQWPENRDAPRAWLQVHDVSIHSGHQWPENPRSPTVLKSMGCFNPLRPSMAGEPRPRTSTRRMTTVSIHSGHQWPENPFWFQTTPSDVMFQSTPAINGRRTILEGARIRRASAVSIHSGHQWPENRSIASAIGRSRVFQSTPAINGRRTRLVRSVTMYL